MAELMQAYERAREIRGKAAWAEQVIDIADEAEKDIDRPRTKFLIVPHDAPARNHRLPTYRGAQATPATAAREGDRRDAKRDQLRPAARALC
jgi:hypothetical protein